MMKQIRQEGLTYLGITELNKINKKNRNERENN